MSKPEPYTAPHNAGPRKENLERPTIYGDGFDELRERAWIALTHGAEHTFIRPGLLLEFLGV